MGAVLEQLNAIFLQVIVRYALKNASCLHFYHSSIDLHDSLYARPHPACEKRSRFQSRAALKSWVWSGVRGKINCTLSGSGLVNLGEIECMDTNEKQDNVIVNLAARESRSLGVTALDHY